MPTLLAALLAVLLGAGSAVAEPPAVSGKRAEADQVLAEIREIDSRLARAAEAYNLANIKLASIAREQQRNTRLLGIARTNLTRSQRALEARLVALYTGGDTGSTLEVLLGATSLDDLLSRLDTADRVSSQDAAVLEQVTSFRAQVRRQKVELATARTEQERIVAARSAEKRQVEQRLVERQRLLSTIRDEIARLQRAERVRQLALARQVRARLAVQADESGSTTFALGADGAPVGDYVAPPARYGGVVGVAMGFLGTPYQWGGSSPSTGFDCSGFVMYVYSQVGVSLPHNAAAQFGYGAPVSRGDLQAGDLVFFDGLGHNGIYIGGGQFIHSPHTGDFVKISSLSDSWYAATFVGGRRL